VEQLEESEMTLEEIYNNYISCLKDDSFKLKRCNRAFVALNEFAYEVVRSNDWKTSYNWIVEKLESVNADGSTNGTIEYTVHYHRDEISCTCPDFAEYSKPCKHVYMVILAIKLENAIAKERKVSHETGSTSLSNTKETVKEVQVPETQKQLIETNLQEYVAETDQQASQKLLLAEIEDFAYSSYNLNDLLNRAFSKGMISIESTISQERDVFIGQCKICFTNGIVIIEQAVSANWTIAVHKSKCAALANVIF
jgi:hypothetical protein